MKSRSVPRKGISGATETVNGGLLQAILWDVYEEKVGVLYKKLRPLPGVGGLTCN